jgi:hypothetical protein
MHYLPFKNRAVIFHLNPTIFDRPVALFKKALLFRATDFGGLEVLSEQFFFSYYCHFEKWNLETDSDRCRSVKGFLEVDTETNFIKLFSS